MGILDSGDWVLVKKDPNKGKTAKKGANRLTISRNTIKLSHEVRKAMESPKYISVWTRQDDGRVIFLGHSTDVSGSYEIRKTKSGTIFFRNDEDLLKNLMERLILFGTVAEQIGPDDKPLPGVYFCVDGTAFKERDPKDGRKWLKGVEFDLAKAYFGRIPDSALKSSRERWSKKEED